METITSAEKRWVLFYSIILVIVTTLPYVLGFQAAGEEWVFSGLLIGVEDGNSYLAKMLRGTAGDWLFRTPYTTQPQSGVLTFLPYMMLGKLAGGSAVRLQLVGIFHIFRGLATLLYTFASYQFVSFFLDHLTSRRWATIMATVGGGLGWLMLPLSGGSSWSALPLSFISPETFGFISILAVPHLAMARGFLLLAILQILEDVRKGRGSIRAAIYVVLIFLFNPLAGVSLVLVLLVFTGARLGAHLQANSWRTWLQGSIAAGWSVSLASPYVLYLAIAYQRHPFLQSWSDQNLILSPHLGYYFLAFGGLLIPAIWGVLKNKNRRSHLGFILITSWLVALPLLVYLPVGFQRRLPEGGWVAIVVAAAWGFHQIRDLRFGSFAQLLVTALSLISPLLLLVGMWQTATSPAEPAFIPTNTARVIHRIADLADKDDVVIANYRNSNLLPSFTPVRVPIGHGPESVNGAELTIEVEKLLNDDLPSSSVGFIRFHSADWILTIGGESVDNSGPWQLVYTVDEVRLFRVVLDR